MIWDLLILARRSCMSMSIMCGPTIQQHIATHPLYLSEMAKFWRPHNWQQKKSAKNMTVWMLNTSDPFYTPVIVTVSKNFCGIHYMQSGPQSRLLNFWELDLPAQSYCSSGCRPSVKIICKFFFLSTSPNPLTTLIIRHFLFIL